MQHKPTLKAHKYRICPSDAQIVFFAKTFGCCRLVWNKMLDEKLQAYKWYVRSFIQADRFSPTSKICHCCGHEKEDLTLDDRTRTCPACSETHDRAVSASINLYFLGLERSERGTVKQALVDDCNPYRLPKSYPETEQEAQP